MTGNPDNISPLKLIFHIGPFIIPILLCSIFAFGISLEKFFLFYKININLSAFKKNIFDLIQHNKIKEALQICDDTPSPVAKIIKAGIIKFGCSKEEIKESIEEVSHYEIPRLELRLSALITLAHISPLLGFLGTIVEMIINLSSIQIRSANMNPITSGDFAGSMAQALMTTAAGLLIAIPIYTLYNYFINRIHYLVLEMEKTAAELIHFMSHSNEVSP